MDFHLSIYFMEQRGDLLKEFSTDNKYEFMNLCNSNFLFYDPYESLFINPFTFKTYNPKTLQKQYLASKIRFNDMIKFGMPSKDQLEMAIEKLDKQNKKAYIIDSIIRSFKYFGIIIGIILMYFVNFYLGLTIGFYIIYIDYHVFDSTNRVNAHIESEFLCAPIWLKKRNLYFATSLVLFICHFVTLALYVKSGWIILVIFVVQKWLFTNPLIRYIVSGYFRASQLKSELEEEYDKQECLRF